jgi:predicted nucleic acid-binding protein
LLKSAAAIKATYPLSLADAWIAASAQLSSAVLIHKGTEFESLSVKQEILPYK